MSRTKSISKKTYDKLKTINSYKNVIIVVLIIIIILLLIHDCDGKKNKDLKDKYDVYELDCDCDKTIDDDTKKDVKEPDKPSKPGKKNNNNNNNNNNNKKDNTSTDNQNNNSSSDNQTNHTPSNNQSEENKSNNEEEVLEEIPMEDLGLEGSDEDFIWRSTSQLHIFRNPVFQMDEIIAPGASNSYKFYIKNVKDCDLAYKLEFEEENPYGVNMKYKLKQGDSYIISNWTSASEITTKLKDLKSNEEDEYTLEWYWEHNDSVDTEIGSNIDAYYKLNINLYGEQVV